MSRQCVQLFVCAILVFCCVGLCGAGTIRGRVTAGKDGSPVCSADVILKPLGRVVSTDRNGDFCFAEVPGGTYTLEAFMEGYYLSECPPLSLAGDGIQEILIELTKKEAVSDAIVVTGTRREVVLADVPVRTEVISSRELASPLVRTVSDAFTAVTGVRVENACQNCNITHIRLNGLEGRYTQVLLDGSPSLSSLALVYGLEQIPPEMIQQIEVVKGGGSALFGASAVAGVVNIVGKNPEETMFRMSYQQGWQNGRPECLGSGLFSAVNSSGDTGILGFGKVDRVAPIDRDGDGFSDMGYKKLEAFGVRFFQDLLANKGQLTVDIHRFHEDRRGGDRLDLPPHEALTAEAADTLRYGGRARWRQLLSGKSFYETSMAFAYTRRDSYYGSNMDPNAYGKSTNPLVNFEAVLHHQIEKHYLVAGLALDREWLKDEALAYDRVIDDVYTNTGVFVQDEITLGNRVTVVGGLRLDRPNVLNKTVMSPRGNVMISLSDSWRLRAAVSRGFCAPKVFDEDLHITQVGGQGAIIINDPTLREESSTSYSAGLQNNWTAGETMTQSVAVTGFYTRLRDAFALQPLHSGDDELVFQRINAGAARSYGVEIATRIEIGEKLGFAAGFTWEQGLYDHPEPDFNQRSFFRTPETYGYLSADYYESRTKTNISGRLQYTGRMLVPHYAGYIQASRLEETPSFYVLDLTGARDLWADPSGRAKVRLTAGVSNLFDQFQSDLDRGPDRDAGYVYGPRYMRTFFAKLEYSFD
ncbi:MAG: TonB-dependent receptor [Acidobacteriota bacterium]